METQVYQHHIFYYTSNDLAPCMGWSSRQLPSWHTPYPGRHGTVAFNYFRDLKQYSAIFLHMNL
jgi:hypothetical protein